MVGVGGVLVVSAIAAALAGCGGGGAGAARRFDDGGGAPAPIDAADAARDGASPPIDGNGDGDRDDPDATTGCPPGAADGTPCDDHDVCTSNDRCQAGRCAGLARASTPQILGTLRSFGDQQDLGTNVAFVGDDRAVFATGNTLTLVRLNGDRLQVADQRDSRIRVVPASVSPLIWVVRPATFMVALARDRVAVIGSGAGIDLYDVGQGRLSPSKSHAFTFWEGMDLRAATGADQRIWTCVGGATIYSYAVDPDTDEISARSQLDAMGARGACQGLSLSPDGRTLLVSTRGGVDLVDVSSADGSMRRAGGGLDRQFIFDAAMVGGRIVAYRLDGTQQSDGSYFADVGYGSVLVVTADTLDPITSFPIDLSGSGATPVGFAVAGDRILIERADTQRCARDTAELYDFDPLGVHLIAEWTVVDLCPGLPSPQAPLHVVGSTSHAVLEPSHQMVRIDPDTGALTTMRGFQQGSFERVRAVGPTTVEVHSPVSIHLVDVSRPEAPEAMAGGLIAPLDAQRLRLEIADHASAALLTVPTNSLQPVAGAVTTLVWREAGGLPEIAGSIANDDAQSRWAAAGASFYQVRLDDTAGVRVRRFAAAGVRRQPEQIMAPEWDQVLTVEPPPSVGARTGGLWFDVDAQTGDLAVLETRVDPGASAGAVRLLLSWFMRQGAGYQLSFTQTLDALPVAGFALAGDRVVVAYRDRVSLARRGDAGLQTMPVSPAQIYLGGVLRFDAARVHLSVSFPGSPIVNGVLVLRTSDLGELARYTTGEPVLSLTEVGDNLAFGMASTLVVAAPACPAAP